MPLTQLASDNFTRANENPLSDSGSWTVVPAFSNLQIVSNLCEATVFSGSAVCGAYWSALTWPPDQYNQATLNAIGSSDSLYLGLRRSLVNGNSYYLEIPGPIGGTGARLHGLTFNRLFTCAANASGDVWRVQVIGNVISVYQNGVLLLTYVDNVDNLASGVPALNILNNGSSATLKVSGWAGGSVTSPSSQVGAFLVGP